MTTKVALRGIKHVPSMSEETECFSATVYIDGEKRGTVGNRGCGGSDDFHPHGLEAELDAYAKTLPPHVSSYDKTILPMSAELLVADLLGKALDERMLKRQCAKKTLFRVKGDPDGEYRQIKAPYGPKVVDYIFGKYGGPNVEILNETLKLGKLHEEKHA